jgi:PPOX class probable F420-dependent enzyme
MNMLDPELVEFLDSETVGVLATQGPDGRPRQSVVYYARDRDRLLISMMAHRQKTHNVARSGWASLCVLGHERPFPSTTMSGPTEVRTVQIGPPTTAVMRRVTGTATPPEPLADEALVEAGRVILAITIERVGPTSYIGQDR